MKYRASPYEFRVDSARLSLVEQLSQIDYGRVSARKIIRHHQRMVCRQAVATAVQNHWRTQRIQAGLQLANYLPHTGLSVLILQHVREIELGCSEEMHKRPGGAACLEKDIVSFPPGCAHIHRV